MFEKTLANFCDAFGFHPKRGYDVQKLYEVYQSSFHEGRKAEREDMRCETCKHFKPLSEYNGSCYNKKTYLVQLVIINFGCRYHEKKEAM